MHFLRKRTLPRRAFLRGLNGTLLYLPALEVMGIFDKSANAQGAASRKKYLIVVQGNSYCVDMTKLPSGDISAQNFVIPRKTGANYDIRPGIGILNNYADLKPYVSIYSGLSVPNSGAASLDGRLPDGPYHEGSLSPILLGATTSNDNKKQHAALPTSDLIVGKHLQKGSPLPSLGLGVQSSDRLRAFVSQDQYINYTIYNVEAAFRKVFPGQDASQASDQRGLYAARKKLLLDQVLEARSGLLKKVSDADRKTLEDYFERVHVLNKQVHDLSQLSCSTPDIASIPGTTQVPDYHRTALVFRELIALGFQCDLFHSAVLQTMAGQSFLPTDFTIANQKYNFFEGADRDRLKHTSVQYHELGHYQGGPDQKYKISAVNCWALDHYFYIADKLRQMPSGAGNVLDESALLFTWESGFDIRLENQVHRGYVHSGSNKVMLMSGGAGKLKAGVHLNLPGKHPASIILTAMQQLGVPVEKFGEIDAAVPEILG